MRVQKPFFIVWRGVFEARGTTKLGHLNKEQGGSAEALESKEPCRRRHESSVRDIHAQTPISSQSQLQLPNLYKHLLHTASRRWVDLESVPVPRMSF